MLSIIALFGKLSGITALILLAVTLLGKLVVLVGFLLALVKFAIVVVFIALLIMIVMTIVRDRSRRRREPESF